MSISGRSYRVFNLSRLLLVAWVVITSVVRATTYYIDASAGRDVWDGISPATAWQSLAKVNAVVFHPGDTILFKSGGTWAGELKPQGSGRAGAPIVVTMYGGSLKPVINGNGVVGEAAVYLNNVKFWEVNNLDISNTGAAAADRRGVLVSASDFGLVEHIYLRNLDVHHVTGLVGDDDNSKRTGGIGIETTTDKVVYTRFDDILIEGCTVSYVDNTGIFTDNRIFRNVPGTSDWVRRRFTNVRIRNNAIHHIAKNAMIIRTFDKGVIEQNVCYETALKITGNTMFTSSCLGTVFQFNEGYLNRATEHTPGGGDGSMYDADLKSSNIVFQYSYSHDNSHGLLWTCTVQLDSAITCRYNISRNDKGIIFCINYPVTSVYCYNNTVYSSSTVSPTIISERSMNAGTRKYAFYNNIIYNLSPTASYDFRTTGYTRIINNNLFYGFNPPDNSVDSNRIIGDPLFINPSAAGTGLSTALGFALQKNSPAINKGIQPADSVDTDYVGFPVPWGGKYDLGALEYHDPNGVGRQLAAPGRANLLQAYPNPFNPATTLEFVAEKSGRALLQIYDTAGKHVSTLFEGSVVAGDRRSFAFCAGTLASGMYVAVLNAGTIIESYRLLLLK